MEMKKPNLKFDGDLIFDEVRITKIPCEIIFPKTQDKKVILKAELDNINLPFTLSKFPFKSILEAKIFNFQENTEDIEYIIYAKKVYLLGINSKFGISGKPKTILKAQLVGLKIRHFFNQKIYKENNYKEFYFWLTPSHQLSPNDIIERNFNGTTSILSSFRKKIEIAKNLNFNFIDYYSYFNDSKQKNITISKSLLAAEFRGNTNSEIGENSFQYLDLFLKLVSFSERRRIVCYGYKGVVQNELIDFYRGNITVPKENFNHSTNDMLISPSNFIEFIEQALSLANKCTFKDYLFDSLNKASYCRYSNIENEYLSYYAALENLVNGFKDEQNLHYILDKDSWKDLNKNLKNFIKQHDLFENKKDKRKLIYEKLSELNRISFSSAFGLFCKFYDIDLNDLWTISGGYKYSLTKIRNLLIHGEKFEPEELNLLIYAKHHLKWTLERCILRILSWNIQRSNVSASFLTNFNPYNEWQHIRNSL